MLAVLRLRTSLHTRELLNRTQFRGDKIWHCETRVTRRVTKGQLLPRGIPREPAWDCVSSLPTDKSLHRPDTVASPPPGRAAAPATRLVPRGSVRDRFRGRRPDRARGGSRDRRASRDRIRAAL